MFLPTEYNSDKRKQVIESEVRKKIFKNSNLNLDYLLNKRFYWMKKFIPKNKKKNHHRTRIWKWMY